MARDVKPAILAASVILLSGCFATSKTDFKDPNETAIDFTKRLSVEFSNKLDKVINSTLSSSPVDKGDYIEKSGYFFAVSAGFNGTKDAFWDFCRSKGGNMSGDFCVDKNNSVIFMATLKPRLSKVPDGVDYTVAQPKDPAGSATLNAMVASAKKETEQANETRRMAVEAIRRDKEIEEARGMALYAKTGRGDRICASSSVYYQEYWGFVEDKANGKYKVMIKGAKKYYDMKHFRPDELTWVDPRQWAPC
ncbi:hypothetical protein GBZ26_04135 [Azospirillum formosense]|uniref:Lipoprotein n=1 Tax=Azospirillum formosense TaxID=861533 RepID=A0ABX2KSQ2_9PROT|nr:hypothetical protein [Azospirillum formosense]MBY3755714.1 hypothetical protein [Azospirillum formosense]NUB18412.1 hypothetical protein [Azospirillum formosense]